MTFVGMNYLAVVVAALAGFGVGAVWYTAFGKAWLGALGKTEDDIKCGGGIARTQFSPPHQALARSFLAPNI